MRVIINGQEQELAASTVVAGLVAAHKLNPKHVAVEINRTLVPRRQFEATVIREGDQVEIVTLVGGG